LIDCTMTKCVWGLVNTLDHAAFVEMVVKLSAIWFAWQRLIDDDDQQSLLSTFYVRQKNSARSSLGSGLGEGAGTRILGTNSS
jgi:hypothetical protein